ncbi:MAG: mandelate racemase/muconate lactonizing enzyme family protein [Planctomycetes bacterium]|nr:mandelate racemase/muconate lactonizing enzyme family protein [Planctomycetota bacterium]
MPIHIREIRCRIVEHRLMPDRVIVSAAGRHDRSRFLWVELIDDRGVHGHGEAATTPLWSGESAESAQAIVEQLLAPAVVGRTFDHPREVQRQIDSVTHANPFARSAVDTAAWDLWARSQNKRIVELIGDRAPLSVPTRASVGCYDVPTTLRIATEFWNAGVRTLKFKIGVAGFSDADRLRAVRDALGEEPVFTVDANGAYATPDDAVRAIETMLPYRLALVEQPTHRDRISHMAAVRRRIAPVPLLADEAIFTPDHLAEALDLDAFDILSVYPGKNGGFTHTLDMVRTAQRAGKRCTIGSNLESDLGQAAMVALTSSLSAFPVWELACDLGSSLYYDASPVRPALTLRHGEMTPPSGPGFGVEPAI